MSKVIDLTTRQTIATTVADTQDAFFATYEMTQLDFDFLAQQFAWGFSKDQALTALYNAYRNGR